MAKSRSFKKFVRDVEQKARKREGEELKTCRSHYRGIAQESLAKVAMRKHRTTTAKSSPILRLKSACKVTVDYRLRLEAMVAKRKYFQVNSYITAEHFPLWALAFAPEHVEIRLVRLVRDATTDEVRAEIRRRNERSATLPELLAMGAKHCDLHRSFWIVALGSSWRTPDGDLCRPLLVNEENGRRGFCQLSLASLNKWSAGCLFAVVRKSGPLASGV